MQETDRAVEFRLNGSPVATPVFEGESLLTVLRERFGVLSVKDGCAPQGQCGCCTVLVDGSSRVACVTPAERIAGRDVTTVEGLDPVERDRWAAALCATGGSQCGFCTPGIIVRLVGRGSAPVGRALAGHLCRCTGWQTIVEAAALTTPELSAVDSRSAAGERPKARDLGAAARRAELECGVPQRVSEDVPVGAGGFADDTAPRDALVAVPSADGGWAVAETLHEARAKAGKVQGRNAPIELPPPIPLPALPPGGVRLATSWVEPAYLEPDASWCEPGGEPASPLANGGAFGGKEASPTPAAARQLADELGRTVRVVLSREDVVRTGPKRPPVSASAVVDGRTVRVVGSVVDPGAAFGNAYAWPYQLDVEVDVHRVPLPGPRVSDDIRAAGWAEQVVLVEGAVSAAGLDRAVLVDGAGAQVLLDTCVLAPTGARAGARASLSAVGGLQRIDVKVAAGDPLDAAVLRSYCIGATHMALGWVCSERIAVDPETGEVLDLTIRSFGILPAKEMPSVEVEIVESAGPPLGRASDAVFAAVAAATWNALGRPETLPARR